MGDHDKVGIIGNVALNCMEEINDKKENTTVLGQLQKLLLRTRRR